MDKKQYLDALKNIYKANGANQLDVESAIEYAEELIKLNLPVIFDRKHLIKLLGIEMWQLNEMMTPNDSHHYRLKSIPKKTTGTRDLMIPSVQLKQVQRWILQNILNKVHLSDSAMGFRYGKSILDNARIHTNKECIVNLDIKDFFPSIKRRDVFRLFYYLGYTSDVSLVLSKLCTYKNVLPQGAPTSPYLSNIVCLKLDKRLSRLAEKYGAQYSRYADDITFSGNCGLGHIIPVATLIIEDEGFSVNEKKTRILYSHQKQEVTGLIVNSDRPTVDSRYIKDFLKEIYYCKKYGPSNHMMHMGCEKRFFKDHMYGKAYFVKMVNRDLGLKLISELDLIDWDL